MGIARAFVSRRRWFSRTNRPATSTPDDHRRHAHDGPVRSPVPADAHHRYPRPEIADYADRVITLIDGAITSDVTHTPIYDGTADADSLPPESVLPEEPKLPEGPIPAEEEEFPLPPDDEPLILPDDGTRPVLRRPPRRPLKRKRRTADMNHLSSA